MKSKIIITAVIALVLGAAIGFYVKTYLTNQQMASRRSQFSGQRGSSRGGAVTGEILSMDEKSITVKLMDGSSKIVLISDTSIINKSEMASKSDLKVGVKIMTFGMTNPDGSVTAQNITLQNNH